MAENILNARIQLKYDLYENWQASSVILKKGELAIAEIPGETQGSQLTPPAIGIKVGDGINTFANLNWIQAIAGDIADWAKAAKKPEYNASEITDLDTYIEEHAADSNTLYKIVTEDEGVTYKLQKKDSTDEDYIDVPESVIDLTEFKKRLDSLTGAFVYKGSVEILPETTEGYANGDVVSVGNKEYVCDNGIWRELGDEGSYVVKGSIKNADIAENANIDQSKINGLEEALASAGQIKKIQLNGEDLSISEDKSVNIELAEIAKTGEVRDLKQTDNTILVFNCGSATTIIDEE